MTTNNHPANGPVSLERLHQIRETLSKAAAQSDGGNIGYAMADAVKVIDGAIASFGTEPVAWMIIDIDTGEKIIRPDRSYFEGPCHPLYAAPQLPQPAPEKIAMQNFRAAMEGIGHIRRTLDETFGGLRGTHCEPDVLVECKAICDAIYEAYRKTAPVTPDGWQLVPKEPTEAMNKAGWAAINEHDAINPTYRAMLAAAPQQEVKSSLEHGMQRYAGAMQKLADAGD
ncbi:hypothetical protein R9Y17_001489 [Citrobacter freundii]|uniref:hypothetical protein n=1 Tax=Citrobacter portucalensis TaxID=1639133 RepID=UPI0023B2DC84|nr:hypothetical protein [Citrobacter portucalensis]ELT7645403.1 hypothetical protein [Citrobacter freundii]MDE9607742.1 hypothetical protein [Citrobacter portucalensis]